MYFKTLRSVLHCPWIGPMPVESFFQAFLDIDKKDLKEIPECSDSYFDTLLNTSKETELYKHFINLVSDSHIATNLKLFDNPTHEDEETGTIFKNKPDIMAYENNPNVTSQQPNHYSYCEVIFELQRGTCIVDPFTDLSDKATTTDLNKFLQESTPDGRRNCRAQLIHYARAWMSRQHRTHCFMVWIGGPLARIIRFDRSGAVVTEQFDIRSKSHLLVGFLWRISRASPEMRGKDTTVSVVTDEDEIQLAKEKLATWAPYPRKTNNILKFNIPVGGPANDPQWRQVLVWAPLGDPHFVPGRATCGYPAWDLKYKKLVFVKDSWRVLAEDISKEIDILRTLRNGQACNIPQHTTRTQEFADTKWNMGGKPHILSKRVHVRFTSDLMRIPLAKFDNRGLVKFVQAWFDALLAHDASYTTGDINLNNLLLTSEGGGFLNDWDRAGNLDDIEPGPPKPFRSGTWQFMSVGLLGQPEKKYTLQDDLESFFWLLLYVTIRYVGNTLVKSRSPIPEVMRAIFDTVLSIDRKTTGGWHKERAVLHGSLIGDNFSVTNNEPLSVLLDDISWIVQVYLVHCINVKVSHLVEDDRMTLESATATRKAREKRLELCSHNAMLAFYRTALDKEWPVGDGPSDHRATLAEQSSKRTAVDDIAPGSGSERTMKRLKLDNQANDKSDENGSIVA